MIDICSHVRCHPSFHGSTKYPFSLRPWANPVVRSHRPDCEPLDLEADGRSNQPSGPTSIASAPVSSVSSPWYVPIRGPYCSQHADYSPSRRPTSAHCSPQFPSNSRPSRVVENNGIVDPILLSARFIHCQVSVTIESTRSGALNGLVTSTLSESPEPKRSSERTRKLFTPFYSAGPLRQHPLRYLPGPIPQP